MIEALNKKFSLGENLFFAEGNNGLTRCVLAHKSGHTTEIYTYGAHVTAWNTPQHKPLLFMSSKSHYTIGKAIRGGIPLVFPQFGGGALPSHGFARTNEWGVKETQLTENAAIKVVFTLTPNESITRIWPHDFTLEYAVTLSETLSTSLKVINSGKGALSFALAFHTYFQVSDIKNVEIKGLKGLAFLDSLKKRERCQEEREVLTFGEEVDRIYLNTPDSLQILDKGLNRTFMIRKNALKDAVVWNPWIAKAKALEDFEDEEYLDMVCVETGNVGNMVSLDSSSSAEYSQELSYK